MFFTRVTRQLLCDISYTTRGVKIATRTHRAYAKAAKLHSGSTVYCAVTHGTSLKMNSVLFHVILLAYLLATVLLWLYLGLRHRTLFQLANGLVLVGFGLQTIALGAVILMQSEPWWPGAYASMELLAWALIVSYGAAWWYYRIEALGSFMVPLAFIAFASSGLSTAARTPLSSVLQQFLLVLHIFLATLGYAALALTFCAGVMYLMQEHQLKSKHPGILYHRLPSLRLLDELNAQALVLGLPLLTQGVITGSVWAKQVRGSYLNWSLTSVPLLLAWVLYALLIGGRYMLGWQGRKAACAAVTGFLLVLASYFVHTL